MGEYRCYSKNDKPPTCGLTHFPSAPRGHSTVEGDPVITSLILFGSLALILLVCTGRCFQRSSFDGVTSLEMGAMHPHCTTAVPATPVPGMPVGCARPACGYPGAPACGYPGCAAYPVQQGYSGGGVAMGAGMGFLGGMMVGEMLSDGGHHHGYGGGDYGGGDYGGGDYGGSGDFGGGGDFAADM
eukprot:CAMPEP_0183353346 /NCGR_PEP_ID=MMETSP0164_2-20130417/33201_1 /TAXON_ID=221442 /ORGANISM="Coccolithus pelagicus ssp braarudi, Strain PLY182g" /LENGTH=184 /DNA_ID=CAMNT_0025526005 /DNA_START=233 /DNA_END=787 /DNA_ORIENTATION=-